MKRAQVTPFVCLAWSLAAVALLAAPFRLRGASPSTPGAIAATRPALDRDVVRNGGFDLDKAGWATNPIGTYVAEGFGAGGIGKGMQIWPEFADPFTGYMQQELFLPSHVAAARFYMDYQFVPDAGAALDRFEAVLATSEAVLVTLVEVMPSTYPGQGWQSTGTLALDVGAVSALNTAHSAGQRVFLLVRIRSQSLRVNVDNVKLAIDGSEELPDWRGSIAYIGLDESGAAKTVRRIDPAGIEPRTLWVHPSSGPTNAMYDLAWKPDAAELAFASNHESAYSAFHSDVYGIGPDGAHLRRITNPPSKAALDGGGFPVGTVVGRVRNGYGPVTGILVYIQGAREPISVAATGYGDEAAFTVPDVAYLGPGLHYVVLHWWSAEAANCREYAAAVVQVVPDQTVDVGTLELAGTCGKFHANSRRGTAW